MGRLGPSEAKHEQTSTSFNNLRTCHDFRSFGPSWRTSSGLFGPSWKPPGPSWARWRPFYAVVTASWAVLETFCGHHDSFGAMFVVFGGHFGRLGGHLGGASFGPSWAVIGPSWRPLWRSCGDIRGLVGRPGPSEVRKEAAGQIPKSVWFWHIRAILETLGASLGLLGPSSGHLRPTWQHPDPSWRGTSTIRALRILRDGPGGPT